MGRLRHILRRRGRRILLYLAIYFGMIGFFWLLRWDDDSETAPRSRTEIQTETDLNELTTDSDPSRVPYTSLNVTLSKDGKESWKSWRPSNRCPRKSLVGNRRLDGGKWVCGLQTLGTRSLEKECIVYSFGVGLDSSYEQEILESTKCDLFAFDPTVNQIANPIKKGNPRIKFWKVGLSGTDVGSMKTLQTLMDERGHRYVDILKIAVGGLEYESLERMLKDFRKLPFGQLLVEFHLNCDTPEVNKVKKERGLTMASIISLVRDLEKRGSRVFSIDTVKPALGPMQTCCAEFSFINLKYLDLFLA